MTRKSKARPSNETLTVYVITASNKKCPFIVDKFDSVFSLKEKIYKAEGILPSWSRLLFNGRGFIKYDDSLNYYNVTHKSIIEVYEEQCGC